LIPGTADRYIVLDCEGDRLGYSQGSLGLIQIGLPQKNDKVDIYLVDPLKMDNKMGALFQVLQDDTVKKYMWDCRQDYAELRHSHACTIEGIYDLQLVELKRRMSPHPANWVWPLGSLQKSVEAFDILSSQEKRLSAEGILHLHSLWHQMLIKPA